MTGLGNGGKEEEEISYSKLNVRDRIGQQRSSSPLTRRWRSVLVQNCKKTEKERKKNKSMRERERERETARRRELFRQTNKKYIATPIEQTGKSARTKG